VAVGANEPFMVSPVDHNFLAVMRMYLTTLTLTLCLSTSFFEYAKCILETHRSIPTFQTHAAVFTLWNLRLWCCSTSPLLEDVGVSRHLLQRLFRNRLQLRQSETPSLVLLGLILETWLEEREEA
jgi:hypothetical protein